MYNEAAEAFYAKNPGARPKEGAPFVVNPVTEPELTPQERLNRSAGRDMTKPFEPVMTVASEAPSSIVPASVGGEFSDGPAFTTPLGYETPAAAPAPAASPYGSLQNEFNKINHGNELESLAIQNQANKEADFMDAQIRSAEERKAQREIELSERQQLKERKQADLEVAQQEYLAAKNEAGKSYWEDKSTFSKISAAIAQGLGAYSAAMTGTENFAAKTIESAVRQDTDLKVRKAQLAKDRTTEVAQRYDSLLGDLKDESAVRDVMYADGLMVTKAKIDQVGARAKSESAKAKALQASGELGIKIKSYLADAAAKSSAAQGRANETFVPGLNGHATTKEGATKLNELSASTASAKDGINKLIGLSSHKGGSMDPTLKAEASATADFIRAALRLPILGPGTVNDAERAILNKIVANPTDIFSLNAVSLASLKTAMERLDDNLVTAGIAQGISGKTSGESKMYAVEIDGQKYVVPQTSLDKVLARKGSKVLGPVQGAR